MYNNDLTATYDKSLNKWFERNSDGTRGQEIKVGANMNSRKQSINFTTAVGNAESTVTLSQPITDLNKCMLIPSVRSNASQIGFTAEIASFTKTAVTFIGPANGNTGTMTYYGTLQIIEWD